MSIGSTCRSPSSTTDPNTKDSVATPDVSLAGVDTTPLTPREKKEWDGYVTEFLAPCANVPVSIAQCVQQQRACATCLPSAKYILKLVRDGMSREQVGRAFRNRFDAAAVKSVALDGSPALGPESAPITIIEFADFECPGCGVMSPLLDKAQAESQGKVRLVFKFMPLASHPHGEISARAVIAAWEQGKMWPMHHKLFENQRHLEPSDLEGYAKDLGLDLTRFRADRVSAKTTERIERDCKLAEAIDVRGTPEIYINGRLFDPRQDLNDWIKLELMIVEQPAP